MHAVLESRAHTWTDVPPVATGDMNPKQFLVFHQLMEDLADQSQQAGVKTRLVQGPPGTGKTYLIGRILKRAVLLGNRTMCCTHSGAALQVNVRKFLSLFPDGNEVTLKFVIACPLATLQPDLHCYALDRCFGVYRDLGQLLHALGQCQEFSSFAERCLYPSAECDEQERQASVAVNCAGRVLSWQLLKWVPGLVPSLQRAQQLMQEMLDVLHRIRARYQRHGHGRAAAFEFAW